MGTIRDFVDLNELKHDAFKTMLLNKLGQDLKHSMYQSGGDILVNVKDGSFIVTGCPDELEWEIQVALKS